MSLNDRLVRCMDPGRRYGVVALSTETHEDYARVFFALARLEEFGFVYRYEDEMFSLTETGERLHHILSSPPGRPPSR